MFPATRGLLLSDFVAQSTTILVPFIPIQESKQNLCSVFFFYDSNTNDSKFSFSNAETVIFDRLKQEIQDFNPFLQTVRHALDTNSQIPLFRLVISHLQNLHQELIINH